MCQDSPASKKDLSAKDFLSLSIISAVTRKRKKHQSACPPGNSTDEDSEHEPVKASNYGGKKSGEEEEEGEEDEEDDDEDEDGNEEEEEGRRGGCATVGSERREDKEGIASARGKTKGQQGSQREGGGGGRVKEGEEEEEEQEGKRKDNLNLRNGQEERRDKQIKGVAPCQKEGNYCPMMPGGQVRAKEEGQRCQGGQAVPQVRHPAPRSFLYTHAARHSPKSPPLLSSPTAFLPLTSSPLHPSISSSSSFLSSPSASLSPTSPISPVFFGPAEGDPLTRKKLRRGERVRPHSMYSESRMAAAAAAGDEQGSVGGSTPGTQGATPTFTYPPEILHVSPGTKSSPQSPPCHPSADAATTTTTPVPAGQVWRPNHAISPETRRRRRDWRWHTVVVSLSGEG